MDNRLNKLAKLLVEYSTKIKPEDFVLVSGQDASIPWIEEVVKEAVKKGAHVETIINSLGANSAKLRYSSLDQLKKGNYILEKAIEKADVWISAWGTNNTRVDFNIQANKIAAEAEGNSTWRRTYFDRSGNGELRWCGTQFPTQGNAMEANMSLSEYEDFVYAAGQIDEDDPISQWKRISAEQQRWVDYLDTKKELHIVSENTDIYVKFEGRKWVNCDGKQNFPDGEICTSPVENSINGKINFSFPGIFQGKEIEDINLVIEKGKVIKATAKKGQELLDSLLDLDEGARYFGEVAIGTNYGIKNFTKNMLFDEKIGGTIHMALGNSLFEAGGKNVSTIHWDMLCDMKNHGKIYADDQLFYIDGHFINDIIDKKN
ncbi:MAG TPA: aminopeptidase [Clostridiaceae bacterium]